MFRALFRWTFRLVLVLFLGAAVVAINAIWFRPWSLRVFFDKVLLESAFNEPELLTSLGMVEQFGFTSHSGKLNDESPSHQQEVLNRWKKNLAQLREYSPDGRSPSERLSIRVLDHFLQERVEGERWQWHNYPVNQLFGVQNEFPSFMANTHRLLNEKDCSYYVMRLNAVQRKFDQLLEGLKVREQRQVIPPRFVIDEVLEEMKKFTSAPAAENILASSFKTRAAKLPKLTERKRADFQKNVEKAITEKVYPAYARLIDYFTALQAKAATDDGVWKLPEGDAFYSYCLRLHTTTNLAPEAVHQLGLQEVDRIEKEMRAILDANGLAGQTIAAALDQLSKDPRFLYPNDEAGRTAVLADYTRLLDTANEKSKQLFRKFPKAKCEVRRVPEFREATSSGAYYQPGAHDGTRPGIFFANLRDLNEAPKWSMPTLAYHEGIPGHHFQLSLAQELKGVPEFRKVLPFTAYMEGWALYCERLAKEGGWYEGDPFGDLGRLQAELLRAVRLVVDTGIHAKRWTREQGIAYLREKGHPEKDTKAEVERYIVNPGQACAYKLGMLKLQELRKRAQDALGEKFDQPEFHDEVLKNGALPLDILDEQISNYIAEKRGP